MRSKILAGVLVSGLGVFLTFAASSSVGAPAEPSTSEAWVPGQLPVDGSGLRAFRAVYRQTAGGQPAGSRTLSLERELGPGGPMWHHSITIETSLTVHDELLFDEATWRPRRRSVHLPGRLHRTEVWSGFDGGTAVVLAADGTVESETIEVEGPRLAASTLDLVMALHPSGTTEVPIYSSDFGPGANLVAKVEVGEPKEIEAAGRAWRVVPVKENYFGIDGEPLRLPDGKAFPAIQKWLSPEPPYVIRAVYGPLEVELEEAVVFGDDPH